MDEDIERTVDSMVTPLHFIVKLKGAWWIFHQSSDGPQLVKKPLGGPYDNRDDAMAAMKVAHGGYPDILEKRR
jgi:hypothetical protein